MAVVGAGPAGLTASAELARMGYQVTLFESLHEAGGVPHVRYTLVSSSQGNRQSRNRHGSFTWGRASSQSSGGKECDDTGTDELRRGFSRHRCGLPYFMGLPGENLPGVYSANEFLTRVNLMHADRFPLYDTPVKKGSRVVVLVAEMLRWTQPVLPFVWRKGYSAVYRRREEDLPPEAETARAKEEGIEFVMCARPDKDPRGSGNDRGRVRANGDV